PSVDITPRFTASSCKLTTAVEEPTFASRDFSLDAAQFSFRQELGFPSRTTLLPEESALNPHSPWLKNQLVNRMQNSWRRSPRMPPSPPLSAPRRFRAQSSPRS